jgi:hypothetical protein
LALRQKGQKDEAKKEMERAAEIEHGTKAN